jgi:hypothetical protein
VRFEDVTAIRPLEGAGHFAADIHPEWTIAGRPNGGYLLAVLGRTAAAVSPHPHPVAASAHYLRPPEPGPVEVAAEVLRAGRNASQLRVRLAQDGRQCIEALFTSSELSPGSSPAWTGAVPDPGRGAFEDAVAVPPVTPAGIPAPIMDQVDLRIDRDSFGFATGRPSGRGEIRGWLALRDGEAFDPISLLYAVDAFPPATFDVATSGWVPTLELTVYVRARPAPGPVRVLHRAHLIDADRVDEGCWVWDSTGRLVAQSTQLAGIRFL